VNVIRDEDERDSAFMVLSPENHSGEWVLDYACSYHMCPNKHLFLRLEEFDGGVVLMGNDDVCEIKGIGTIHLKMRNGVVKTLTEVRYVLDLKKNLFSLGVLESSGYKIIMYGGVLRAIYGALLVLRGTRIGNLYFLDGSTIIGTTAVSKSLEDDEADNSRLWHMRLGHPGEKALQGLVKQGLLKGVKTEKHEFCEHCVLGKQTRVKFGIMVHNTKGILDYVHTNVWGPSKNESLGGNH